MPVTTQSDKDSKINRKQSLNFQAFNLIQKETWMNFISRWRCKYLDKGVTQSLKNHFCWKRQERFHRGDVIQAQYIKISRLVSDKRDKFHEKDNLLKLTQMKQKI